MKTVTIKPTNSGDIGAVLRHGGIPAMITPSGEIRVSHGKLDAVACAERTVYTWRSA